jgi:arsenate reductase
MAVRVLDEIGIDIGGARSKGTDEIHIERADLVVTLCADEVCPVVPASVRRLHWPLEDPAEAWGEEEMLQRFRETRELLAERLADLFGVPAEVGPPRDV